MLLIKSGVVCERDIYEIISLYPEMNIMYDMPYFRNWPPGSSADLRWPSGWYYIEAYGGTCQCKTWIRFPKCIGKLPMIRRGRTVVIPISDSTGINWWWIKYKILRLKDSKYSTYWAKTTYVLSCFRYFELYNTLLTDWYSKDVWGGEWKFRHWT